MSRKRRSGRDPFQEWVHATYRSLIRDLIKSNNYGLNISQITAKLGELLTPEYRQRLEASVVKHGWKMPKGKPTRKKVGEHVNALWADRKESIARVGGGYYLVDSSSTRLNESVRRFLRKKNWVDWNISPARNFAGCYTATDPAKSHQLFFDLLDRQVNRFISGQYWLNDIIAYMIRYKLISPDVYSKENGIDKRLLREGWEHCFGNTQLLVLAYAISPPDFLEYLMSPHGGSWAAEALERRWDSIMNDAANRPRSESAIAALSLFRQDALSIRRRKA